MDLQLATFADIVRELERRKVQYLLVGVEPTNKQEDATVHVSAAATSRQAFVRLLRLARSAFEQENR